MPKEIWNEGRVTGLSSYSIYVKQHLMEDPDSPLATEREWLASSLAMGSSLILKLGTVGTVGIHSFVDIMLPFTSTLAAANTIMASFFNGTAEYPTGNGSKWATRVVSYGTGNIVSNTSTLHPSGTADPVTSSNVPSGDPANFDSKEQLHDYMKIVDGVVIHPGIWAEATNKPPEMDFIPNLDSTIADSRPVLRLHIVGQITSGVQILLTGFTIRSVLVGTSTTEGSTSTLHPQNGDFLGPEVFPWASKVVFSVPNSYIQSMLETYYERSISPTDGGAEINSPVNDTPIIDMESTNPGEFYDFYNMYASYYDSSTTNPRIPFTVTSIGDASTVEDIAALTVYQRKSIYPPALYGTLVDSTGQTYLNPLDVVAPGTIKVFYEQDKSVLIDYETTFPGTTAINKKSDGSIETLDANNDLVRITTNYAQVNFISNDGSHFKGPGIDLSGDYRPAIVTINKSLTDYAYLLALSSNKEEPASESPTIDNKPNASTRLTWDNSYDNITWSALIGALRNNRGLNLLDTNLKTNKYSLYKPVSKQAADSDHDWNWDSTGGEDLYDHESGASYIQFGTDDVGGTLRLYGIKSSIDPRTDWDVRSGHLPFPDPTNIPGGSFAFGVGWHNFYRVVGSGANKSWSPLYGAEFDSSTISAHTEEVHSKEFVYGLIIFGRADSATINHAMIVEPQIGYTYNYTLSDDYTQSTDPIEPTVVWIDGFGNPIVLHQGDPEYDLQVFFHYEEDTSSTDGELVSHTDSVKFINNSDYAAVWMMIGKLHHAL